MRIGEGNWLVNDEGQLIGMVTTGNEEVLWPIFSRDASNNVTGLEGPDGTEVARLDSEPADWMRQQGGVGQIASAMSTTVALTQAIPVASTRVRVAWQGRGSSGALAGTERLYIAANEDNAVAGLVASQDARRRLYTLAPGEAVVLKSKSPITVLHFSANESVSASTHSIQTTYEEAAA